MRTPDVAPISQSLSRRNGLAMHGHVAIAGALLCLATACIPNGTREKNPTDEAIFTSIDNMTQTVTADYVADPDSWGSGNLWSSSDTTINKKINTPEGEHGGIEVSYKNSKGRKAKDIEGIRVVMSTRIEGCVPQEPSDCILQYEVKVAKQNDNDECAGEWYGDFVYFEHGSGIKSGRFETGECKWWQKDSFGTYDKQFIGWTDQMQTELTELLSDQYSFPEPLPY